MLPPAGVRPVTTTRWTASGFPVVGSTMGLYCPSRRGQGFYCHSRRARACLYTDTAAARQLISSLLEPIRLRPVGHQLVGELRGNLAFLLGEDGMVANFGAGRGILRLPPPPQIIRIVG